MKTSFKRVSAAFAALAVMAAAVFYSPRAAAAETAGGCNGAHTDSIGWSGGDGSLTGGSYYLTGNVTLNGEIEIPAGASVTLCLSGCKITAAPDSRVFKVNGSGSLVICDCNGRGTITGNNKSVIHVEKNGSLTLHGGTITGGKATEGGGVYAAGTFTMDGGKISDNEALHQGGGVYVHSGGVFTMNGGVISENYAFKKDGNENDTTYGGGGVYTAGTFTMNGGTITKNNTETSGDGKGSCFGGGVLVSGNAAEFTMKGGTLSGNKADFGGGVHLSTSGTVVINGGTIGGDNHATKMGGGVSVGGGNFTINGGTVSNNTAKYGGGAYVSGGTLTMNNGAKLTNNAAEKNNGGGDGGGAYVSGGTFTMNPGATLSNNKADSNGGGVFLNKGDFTMTGGAITSNTATKNGSCVYMDNKDNNGGTMLLNGAVTITSSTSSNVFLSNGKTITIGNGFSTADKIGIHPETPPANCLAHVPATTYAAGADLGDIGSSSFKSDLTGKHIVYDENSKQVWLIGEHSFNNAAWEKDDVNHWHICTICSKEAGEAAHRWDNGKVTIQPTVEKDGEVTYTCFDCKHTKKEPIKLDELDKFNTPPANNTPNYNYDDDDDYTPTPASSNSQTIVYKDPPTGISLSLAPPALAIAAIAAAIIRRKK